MSDFLSAEQVPDVREVGSERVRLAAGEDAAQDAELEGRVWGG